jgi:hypothetical protein
VLTKMYSNKAKSFAKFLAYTKRFRATNSNNYVTIKKHKETSNFQAAFFALVSQPTMSRLTVTDYIITWGTVGALDVDNRRVARVNVL